jgi:hypothetical protein
MCLTINGEEEGCCGIGVVYEGTPHSEACPLDWGAHSSSQYPCPEGGGGVLELWPRSPAGGCGDQYLAGGSGSHIEACPAIGDHSHDITDVGPIWEPCNMKVWLMSKNLNFKLKKKRILPVFYWGVGSKDRPVRWDVDHMGRSLGTARLMLIICYQSKKYWNWTNCAYWDSYLQYR